MDDSLSLFDYCWFSEMIPFSFLYSWKHRVIYNPLPRHQLVLSCQVNQQFRVWSVRKNLQISWMVRKSKESFTFRSVVSHVSRCVGKLFAVFSEGETLKGRPHRV